MLQLYNDKVSAQIICSYLHYLVSPSEEEKSSLGPTWPGGHPGARFRPGGHSRALCWPGGPAGAAKAPRPAGAARAPSSCPAGATLAAGQATGSALASWLARSSLVCPPGPAPASCSGCPALAPLAAFSSGPSSTTWAWNPHPSPYSTPALPFPWLEARERLEAIPLRGGSVRSPGPASSLSLPEGATSLPPGLITSLHTPVHPLITLLHTPVHPLITSLHSTHLCTHSSLHSTHLYTHSSLHSTPHTCTPTHHFTPHTCAPTHHFTHLYTDSSLHSTHLYTYSSLHSTHLCTHSSLHSTHLYTYSSLHSTHLYTYSSLHSTHLYTYSSLHSTHLYTYSSLHSTHLCTHSSLSAVPNVWTIYAHQPRPSACRDYLYPHSHVHVCMFTVFPVVPITFGFVHSGHQHYVVVWGVPCWLLFCFCLLAFLFLN